MSNNVYDNVRKIVDKMENKIQSDMHLVLLYWKFVDKVEATKESVSTTDLLHKATSPLDIINAKLLLDVARGDE